MKKPVNLVAAVRMALGRLGVWMGGLAVAVGHGLILSMAGAPLAEEVAPFGAGTSLWLAALLLICVPT